MWGVRVMMVNIRKPRRREHDHGSHLEEHSLRRWGVGATPPSPRPCREGKQQSTARPRSIPHWEPTIGPLRRRRRGRQGGTCEDAGCTCRGGGQRAAALDHMCRRRPRGGGTILGGSFDGAEDSDATRQPPSPPPAPHQKDIGQKSTKAIEGTKPRRRCHAAPFIPCSEGSVTHGPSSTHPSDDQCNGDPPQENTQDHR